MATIGYSIPQDLIIEILLRLPAKSVLRFRYVCKLWSSIISSQQFIDAFMSVSLTRPRLVLTCRRKDNDNDRMFFFSSSHQSCCSPLSSSSSMLVAERYNLTMPKPSNFYSICTSVRGFVCCRHGNWIVVCNLTTGQVIHLDDGINYDSTDDFSMYLGYDPNSDQYKVLRIMYPKKSFSDSHVEHSVLTLGGQRSYKSWRSIKTSILYHSSYQKNNVCIDGVVYYKCQIIQHVHSRISSFDVGSELLRLIETPEDLSGSLMNISHLTNYRGKVALHSSFENGFDLWVLDDVKNQIWSKKKTYIFQSFTTSMFCDFRFRGFTSCGEIVYVPYVYDDARCGDSDSLELFCCDVEKKMEKKVRVEGLAKIGRFFPCILGSYVENIVSL